MSKHEINFIKEITIAKGSQTISLDPSQFLYCKDEISLRDEIMCYFYDNVYCEGDIEVYESETSIEIPEKFIEEWKKLKSNHE